MGMSVSVATAIIFIASIISAGSIIGTLDEAQTSLMDAQRVSSERDVAVLRTDIAIVSMDRDNGTVEISNRGQTTLYLSELDVFLDGRWSNDRISSMEIVGHNGSRIWLPDDVLEVRFTMELGGMDIKFLTGRGISVYD